MRQKPIELILLRGWTGDLIVPIMIVDDRDRVIYVNRSAEELLDILRSEVVERPLLEVTRQLDVRLPGGNALPANALVLSEGTTEPAHLRLRFRDSTDLGRDVRVSVIPVSGQEHSKQRGRLGTLIIFWEEDAA